MKNLCLSLNLCFTAGIGLQPRGFSQTHARISYQSMVTPDSVYDIDLKSKELTLRKQKKIPSGYDKSQYVTERIMAPARDGASIPVSIVYKKGYKKRRLAAFVPLWLWRLRQHCESKIFYHAFKPA